MLVYPESKIQNVFFLDVLFLSSDSQKSCPLNWSKKNVSLAVISGEKIFFSSKSARIF